MSRETAAWLNTQVLIGFTDKRGHAWHYRADSQGGEPNHYPGPIPVADVRRRLFNWKAQRAEVLIRDNFGTRLEPTALAITASDNGDRLGLHTDGYGIHQYDEWLLNKVTLLLDGGLQIGSAGLLRQRKQAWVSVEVPDNIMTPEGVEFRPNLLACTSHDASLKSRYKRVVTNVVCDNTMAAGLRETGQEHAVAHTSQSDLNVLDARAALNMVETIAGEFAAEVKKLCETAVTDEAWRMFLDAHDPLPAQRGRAYTNAAKRRSSLTRLWTSDSRVSPWRGTGWGVVQAVNTRQHHEATVQGATRPERNMTRVLDGGLAKLDHATVSTLRTVLATI
ncbi:hypothetical protein GCM10022222_84410 [Amycolatopsis ultiminotia]|uniref:Phage/plasmid-like protein TIGR03299 n=1 Tax=Amycolatopsis ultiminotia TaxID=543629 RepID=A0ABP6YR76_9PSEU